jgi:hypothetical protein
MNVPPDLMAKLQHALGAPGDTKAEGLVRLATERLEGPREYHVEVREESGRWEFHSFHVTASEATAAVARARRNFDRKYRVVELLRRVIA